MLMTTPVTAQTADLVLRGGRVFAGRGLPSATAIAIAGERVLASGKDAEIVPPREILTTPVDLTVVGGRVVFERPLP